MPDNPPKDAIYDAALATWGVGYYFDLLVEECAEYVQALSHNRRGRERNINAMLEEMADVEICLEVVKHGLQPQDDRYFQMMKTYKLKRLLARIRKADDKLQIEPFNPTPSEDSNVN